MSHQIGQTPWSAALELARRQAGVVSRRQLLALGVSADRVKHWLATQRLHPVHAGVYAVGRPQIDRFGTWAAALLACGTGAYLSHSSAGALWGLCPEGPEVEVTVARASPAKRAGVHVYRRAALLEADRTAERGLPVTTPARTLIDLSLRFGDDPLEKAINEADRRDLLDPERLRDELDLRPGVPGTPRLRRLLDRRTFRLTDSQLERRFLPLARRAGLPPPLTRQIVNGYRVDFFWRALGLVVETDGLRYHRTPSRQSQDARRDQVHTGAGLTPLRFTHEQIRYHPAEVEFTLRQVVASLVASDGSRAAGARNASNPRRRR